MTGIAEVIVALWLLPVTLFIIVPLAMFAAWHLGLGWACRTSPMRLPFKNRADSVTEANALSTA